MALHDVSVAVQTPLLNVTNVTISVGIRHYCSPSADLQLLQQKDTNKKQ